MKTAQKYCESKSEVSLTMRKPASRHDHGNVRSTHRTSGIWISCLPLDEHNARRSVRDHMVLTQSLRTAPLKPTMHTSQQSGSDTALSATAYKCVSRIYIYPRFIGHGQLVRYFPVLQIQLTRSHRRRGLVLSVSAV